MIKRVIFDIDNTLIPWKNEYYNEIFEVLKELNTECSNEEFNKIKQAFGEYENVYYSFNKENMINYINEYTGKKYPKEFMDKIIEKWAKCAPEKIEDSILATLKKLNKQYEMVCLTDWYKEQQIKRLKKVNILRYFQDVYAAENTKRKPFKEAFMQAIGENKPEECIMIGDSFERDIEGALKAGLQAIYYNPKETEKINKSLYCELETEEGQKQIKYYTVSKIDEILNIL